MNSPEPCRLIGILDDGWAGLADAARENLRAAQLVIGAQRTLDLIHPHLTAGVEMRSMDGALARVPGGARARTVDPVTVAGVRFPNRIGLAAGLDKDGVAAQAWARFGFGFAELGTVTAHAQPGNPKPRLFRLPDAVAAQQADQCLSIENLPAVTTEASVEACHVR